MEKTANSTKVNITLLYPIDKDDKEVEPRSYYPPKSLKLLRGIWNDEQLIPKDKEFKWDKVLKEAQPPILSDFQMLQVE